LATSPSLLNRDWSVLHARPGRYLGFPYIRHLLIVFKIGPETCKDHLTTLPAKKEKGKHFWT
jgi:hypothetical protein